MTPDDEKAILRYFPTGADVASAFLQIENIAKHAPARPSEANLRYLISEAAPIYSNYVGSKITLQPDCAFVSFVAAIAQGCGWKASHGTIRDITMRSRPPTRRSTFGRRAVP